MNPIIVALDLPTTHRALEMADRLSKKVDVVKVGYPLFIQGGTRFVEELMGKGFKVFLDLKWHDIPNTVSNAMKSLDGLRPFMVTLHASGGSAMLKAAVQARDATQPQKDQTNLLAVTVLTSVDQAALNAEMRVAGSVADQVEALAGLAQGAGVDGVVASSHEIEVIRKRCGPKFLIVTPGIRPAFETRKDDQRRVMTPAEAIRLGADYLVIGRPIVEAKDPMEVIGKILGEIRA